MTPIFRGCRGGLPHHHARDDAPDEAEFATDVVEMRVISFWGGADIFVPVGLNVEVSEFNLMGGSNVRPGRKKTWRERRAERRAAKPPKRH